MIKEKYVIVLLYYFWVGQREDDLNLKMIRVSFFFFFLLQWGCTKFFFKSSKMEFENKEWLKLPIWFRVQTRQVCSLCQSRLPSLQPAIIVVLNLNYKILILLSYIRRRHIIENRQQHHFKIFIARHYLPNLIQTPSRRSIVFWEYDNCNSRCLYCLH